MRRLRSCLASTGSGGRRRPSAPTRRGCASARDGAGERRRKPSGSGASSFARRSAGRAGANPKRSSGPKSPRWRAGRRRGPKAAGRPPVGRDLLLIAPVGAPFPSAVEGHTGKARLARRRDADGAWAQQRTPQEDRQRRSRANTLSCHCPRKRAIQYTAAVAMNRSSACTGSPLSRGRHGACSGSAAMPANAPLAPTAFAAAHFPQPFRSR
jgi:hypothetical protein